ncbi:ribose-5-phosphate isomerase RpiA [Saccharibacter sp. 17.LH.SD]|uniref:ribose-5-phosphate isomerase RpiA n=1 Tax=Saccharibacter sp. 17.LH.SD TaxID=2689393 RepID=UPI00136D3AE7|nr:ribose-5-phosphate isomerase RpiA [Saccharibacter sp. 17.LH.SD]MXV44004.1 ribose-5-phosphate isomerase RpiA [Saccharibacter sp. 17.LH.SD]
MNVEECKKVVAQHAAALVEPGMVVGLGTGSTAAFMIEALGKRVAKGLDIVGIPTSETTEALARAVGIPITTFASHPVLDMSIDGADEVERGSLHVMKGLGGALLREKIVAQASRRFVVMIDATKPVDKLGERAPVPVEVTPFGRECTAASLEKLGAQIIQPRRTLAGELFVTDNGNMILDCVFGPIQNVPALATRIDGTVGVVEHGLFPNMATDVLVATEREVERWTL